MEVNETPEYPVSSEAVSKVYGKEKLIEFLGHWPSFHDMEVVKLEFDRLQNHPSIYSDLNAEFYVYDLYQSPNSPERKQAFLDIEFTGIKDLEMKGWNHQNAIHGLSIQKNDEKLFIVSWGGCGHDVSFSCESISIMRIRERNPFKEKQNW
ncbi:hypothetical protein VDG1235_2759 [Verrucomicrobiia bacterium DG1235]|nr:hypothetical protein VDG1235_2759 [Verrucomicrobiae bacterium DG1235]